MKEVIKEYFKVEVSKIKPPPIPSFKKKYRIKPWENFLLSAMAVASLVIIYLPGSYNSKIRNLEVTEIAEDALIDRLSRVVYEADLYFNRKRSQK